MNDPQTEGIVLIGEIGGGAEEAAAKYIAENNVVRGEVKLNTINVCWSNV